MNEVIVRDREEKREKIGIGSLWVSEYSDEVFILARVEEERLSLIGLVEGNRQNNSIKVQNTEDVSASEWKVIRGGGNFTRIYHVEIKAEQE